jgi:hypothetical protein
MCTDWNTPVSHLENIQLHIIFATLSAVVHCDKNIYIVKHKNNEKVRLVIIYEEKYH